MANLVATAIRFSSLIYTNMWGSIIDRRPEPSAVSDAAAQVAQYDQVMQTKLAVSYAVTLELLYRVRAVEAGGRALDLACGPGHFTLCLARYLGLEKVRGVDLAEGMVEVATANAQRLGLAGQVEFCRGDVRDAASMGEGPYDLVTCTHAAHHFPDLDTVRQVLSAMDRVTHPDGLVAMVDLVRLRNAAVTERYVNLVGSDYAARGWSAFLADFRHSMYAAWTAEELASAVPRDTARRWVQLVPFGLPTIQCLLGLPRGQKRVMLRGGAPWDRGDCPVPSEARAEYRLLRASLLQWGRRRECGQGSTGSRI